MEHVHEQLVGLPVGGDQVSITAATSSVVRSGKTRYIPSSRLLTTGRSRVGRVAGRIGGADGTRCRDGGSGFAAYVQTIQIRKHAFTSKHEVALP